MTVTYGRHPRNGKDGESLSAWEQLSTEQVLDPW